MNSFGKLLLISLCFTAGAVQAELPGVVVYKSPTCGCCKKWITHLQEHGFTVESHDVQDVVSYKIRGGVPPELASCHTAFIGGYTVEGHVPAADIVRLLRTKPDISGLAVPGMPVGSPGMEQGARQDAYKVIAFDRKTAYVFSSHPDGKNQ